MHTVRTWHAYGTLRRSVGFPLQLVSRINPLQGSSAKRNTPFRMTSFQPSTQELTCPCYGTVHNVPMISLTQACSDSGRGRCGKTQSSAHFHDGLVRKNVREGGRTFQDFRFAQRIARPFLPGRLRRVAAAEGSRPRRSVRTRPERRGGTACVSARNRAATGPAAGDFVHARPKRPRLTAP
jgi:hypothetical protein